MLRLHVKGPRGLPVKGLRGPPSPPQAAPLKTLAQLAVDTNTLVETFSSKTWFLLETAAEGAVREHRGHGTSFVVVAVVARIRVPDHGSSAGERTSSLPARLWVPVLTPVL